MQEEKSYSRSDRETPIGAAMDAVRKLILEFSQDHDVPLSTLSREVGKNHAYLQQFIHRGVPAKLPEDVREALARRMSISEDQLRGNKDSRKPLIAGVNPKSGVNATLPNVRLPSLEMIPGDPLAGSKDLPVFAATQGGRGALILSTDPVDYTTRPDALQKVKDGYAIIVVEDSMSPEFEPGDMALVHPHLPPKNGRTCVFYAERTDGTIEAVIKRLRRATPTEWHVTQFNPPRNGRRDYVLKRSEWQKCHVTVGNHKGS